MKDILKESGLKVFNRKTDTELGPLNVYVDTWRIRFTGGSAEVLGLVNGGKVEFLQLNGRDWFAVKSELSTGYLITHHSRGVGFACNSSKVCRKILSSMVPGKEKVYCHLEETTFEYKGNPVYKIVKKLIQK